ncbi:phosphatase 2C-like domain-containing protein [Chlamydoabsidia padenii]|nr:phosphatase 2C-like domain-containing protein [Chlamydoabsidia padenii]
MCSKSHLIGVSKQLEPLVFKSSLSNRTLLPTLIRPYQQQQQQQSTSFTTTSTSSPVVELWPTTTSSLQPHQHQNKNTSAHRSLLTIPSTNNHHLIPTSLSTEPIESSLLDNITTLNDIPSPSFGFYWTPPHQQVLHPLLQSPLLLPNDPFATIPAATKERRPDYKFAHGASGFAKRRQHNKRRPYHPPKQRLYSEQMGEDAFFRRSDSFGISDGVGGWSGSKAADPAFFARQLMHHAYLELERYDNIDDPCFSQYENVDPVQILQKSYEASLIEAEKDGIVGSCTACLAVLRHDELRIANLGDCGISVIRRNNYIFRSEEQQHAFNFPYQLGTGSSDQPKDAQVFNVKVEKDDIIIMGSDGLYDNLFDKEILAIIKTQLAPYSDMNKILPFEPQLLSDALAHRAKTVSDNRRNVDSPFRKKAIHEGYHYQGGKMDDISVVVAVVRDIEDSLDGALV